MHKFINLALVLFASVAIVCAAPYGPPAAQYGQPASSYGPPAAQYGEPPSGPLVEQVQPSSLGVNIDQYLGGSSSAGNYGSKQVVTGYAPVTNVASAPAAPAYNAPAASAYNAPAAPAYGAPAYGGSGYSAPAPKYSTQNAYSLEVNPGQSTYQAYQSPPSYSRVALPVAASDPVAKLYIQQKQAGYGAPANAYGAPANAYGAPANAYGANY